ncbi:MAG: cysteine desulfurase [Bacillaceae bacterium]|nr:cysteine desulfurase [Bacillaceae bacterium]
MIYLDNSATTRPYPEVLDTMKKAAEEFYGNPSSLHKLGEVSRKVLDQSRKMASRILGVKAGEIVFTSGATESNNLAIKGIAHQYQNRGKHLITSAVEHASVYQTCRQLEDSGFDVTYLPVDRIGRVAVEDVKKAIRQDTILVSVMHVNNELGTIQPIQEIGELLKTNRKVFFHVDAVQAFGKLDVKPAEWGVDLLSLSAHKFHGPRGAGLMYIRSGVKLSPLITGGGQEHGFRSGTENLPAIAGMVKAMKMSREQMSHNRKHFQMLKERLVQQLKDIEGVIINSPTDEQGAPHIVNFSVPGLKSEVIIHSLEEKDIYVSTQSACSSSASRPSRILLAIGLDEKAARSGIRVSFEKANTIDEIDRFVHHLKEIVTHLKKVMRV